MEIKKNEYGQLSNCLSVDDVLVSVGRSNLGGLSNEGEDLSRGQQLWIGLIVFQSLFLCVAYNSSFWGHIVYYSCALDRHTGKNSEKCLSTPFCASGRQI